MQIDDGTEWGLQVNFDVLRFKGGEFLELSQPVVTEVPCTISGNGIEIGTLTCSPDNLKELAAGFLYSSAFVQKEEEILEMTVDATRWVVSCVLARNPDPGLLADRVFTPGCGRGIMYYNVSDITGRWPVQSGIVVTAGQILDLAIWLQRSSETYQATGGVHTAAISKNGALPAEKMEDIGRNNAVDKIIGKWLLDRRDFKDTILISSGRISTDILHKAGKAGIPVVISRGAPTHQSVLRAQETGITLIGFARQHGFTVYSHKERIDRGSRMNS